MKKNEQPYISHFRTMAESTIEDVKHFVKEFNNYLEPNYLTKLYTKFLVELKHCKEGFPIDRIDLIHYLKIMMIRGYQKVS